MPNLALPRSAKYIGLVAQAEGQNKYTSFDHFITVLFLYPSFLFWKFSWKSSHDLSHRAMSGWVVWDGMVNPILKSRQSQPFKFFGIYLIRPYNSIVFSALGFFLLPKKQSPVFFGFKYDLHEIRVEDKIFTRLRMGKTSWTSANFGFRTELDLISSAEESKCLGKHKKTAIFNASKHKLCYKQIHECNQQSQ